MKSVCVFCGSSLGNNAAYAEAARGAGASIARAGLRLIYGGGKVGLMGVLAEAALEAGGEVTGVIPRALFEREIAHPGVADMSVVGSMHERKEVMASLADAFMALPGGAGTFDEIFEQWTWSQLGIHAKPCGFLNVNGYFDPLLAMIEKAVAEGFIAQSFAAMVAVEREPEQLLARFRAYQPPAHKWSIAAESRISSGTTIRIAAAVVTDLEGRTLLVRKRNTLFFMQPGGKLKDGETPFAALARELSEELGCTLLTAEFLGTFSAPAANEPSYKVEAALFRVHIRGEIKAAAEIEEIVWVEPEHTGTLPLAPLTRDHVLPFVVARKGGFPEAPLSVEPSLTAKSD
jgi:uncharacterized protein (TIGR00730 family)